MGTKFISVLLMVSTCLLAEQDIRYAIDPATQDKTGMIKVEDHSRGGAISEDWMPIKEAQEYLRKKQAKIQRMRSHPPDYSHLPTGERMSRMQEDHHKYGIPLPYNNQIEADQYYKDGVYREIFRKYDQLEREKIRVFTHSTEPVPVSSMIEIQIHYKSYDSSELKNSSFEELEARDILVRKSILSRLPIGSYEQSEKELMISGFMRMNLTKQALTLLYEDPRVKGFVEQSVLDNLEVSF